jgi:hypothetical protein
MRRAAALGLLAFLIACGDGNQGPQAPDGSNLGWSGPQRIGQAAGAGGMQVALDAQGTGVAVWQEPSGTLAATLGSTGTWSPAERLDGETAPRALDAAGSGFFHLAWRGVDGAAAAILARRFVPGQGWTAPVRVSQGGQTDSFLDDASRPDVAVAPDGSAFVAWRQIAGGDHRIWAARHTLAGWDAPDLLATATGNASGVQVAVDGVGNATCAWLAFDGTAVTLRAARFTPAGGWRPEEDLDRHVGLGDMSHAPAVAMAGTAEAFVVVPTAAFRLPRGELMAYRTSGGAWEPPAQIAELTPAAPGTSFQVALDADASGAATVAWLLSGTGPNDLWANRYVRGSGWGMPRRLETRTTNAYTPAVAAAEGGAWVVWLQAETPQGGVELNRVWSSVFTGAAWSAPMAINTDERAQPPDLDATMGGRALAAWSQGPFQNETPWANRFGATP